MAARAAYGPAHRRYVALEPLAEDLDTRIDGRTDTGRATWTGFHRIEKALWADGSLADMTGYANALDLDVLALRQVVGRASYRPVDVAKTANDLLTACVVTMVTGTEERWAHTDLDDLAAAVGAAYGAYAALRPELTDSWLVATLDARFAAVGRALAPYWRGDGYVDYTTFTTRNGVSSPRSSTRWRNRSPTWRRLSHRPRHEHQRFSILTRPRSRASRHPGPG